MPASQEAVFAKVRDEANKVEKVDLSNLWMRKMKTAFNLLDQNKTGVVTDESRKAMTEAFLKDNACTEEEAENYKQASEKFWQMTSHNQEITWEKYYKLRYAIAKLSATDDESKMVFKGMGTRWFDLIDTNRDGVISQQEWQVFFKSMGFKDNSVADKSFSDIAQDGKISKEEFLNAMQDFGTNEEESRYTYMFGPLAEL